MPLEMTSSFMMVPSRPRTGVASGMTVSLAALCRDKKGRACRYCQPEGQGIRRLSTYTRGA